MVHPKIFATISNFPHLLPSTPRPERLASRCEEGVDVAHPKAGGRMLRRTPANGRSHPPIQSHGHDATRAVGILDAMLVKNSV
jgi:hypothetical protein